MSTGHEPSPPRDPVLEAGVFDRPEDPSAWAIYADWLTSRGEPRGELISLELAIEAAIEGGEPFDPAHAARYASLAGAAARRWAEGHLLPLIEEEDLSRDVALEWKRGAPYLARVDTRSLARAKAVSEALCHNTTSLFLQELFVGFRAPGDEQGRLGPEPFVHAELPSLRRFEIDGWSYERRPGHGVRVNLDFDWAAAMPRLRAMALLCPGLQLGSPAHPRLRELLISCRFGLDSELLLALADARFDELESLELWLGRSPRDTAGSRRALAAMIHNPGLGPLRRLGLRACDLPPVCFAELAESRLVRQLERLDLAFGTLGDETMPALRALLDNAESLRELDLTRNYFSPTSLRQIEQRFTGKLRAAHQKPEGERQLPVFGRYGFHERQAW